MLKRNNIILVFFSAIAAIVALLIFLMLPTSQLANGIEHSAKDALWVLVASPVFALVSSVCFILVFIKDINTWSNLLSKPIVTAIIGLSSAFGLVNFIIYLSYTVQQFSLGFVAPFGGTVYELLAVAAVVIVALNFIFSAIVTIATLRNK